MGLNPEAIEARVREINEALQGLATLVARDFGSLGVYEKLSMRYLIIQLVEAAASACIHVLSRAFSETPEAYSDCFVRLGERGAIPKDLAGRLASAARLRNLLVHRYWEVDDEKVYESVRIGLKDFREFVKHVRRLVEGSTSMDGGEAELLTNLEFRRFQVKPEERLNLLDRLKDLLTEIDSIVFAYVHGSFVEANSFRDVDVAVWVEDPDNAIRYAVDVSARLGAELGIPTDVHVLNRAPLPFRYHVYTRGKLLLSRDDNLRLGEFDETLRQYFDIKSCGDLRLV
jgi:uncharacterized protein YutE (UPF0331/DUF86 family)/predicted nucleotidyltransferase